MNDLQKFLNAVMPLRYETVFSLGVRKNGAVCLLGGVAAYNASGEQVALVTGFDCDHRKIIEFAGRCAALQPKASELAPLAVRSLGRRPLHRARLCG